MIYPIYFKEQMKFLVDRHYYFLTKLESPLMERYHNYTSNLSEEMGEWDQEKPSLE